MSIQTLPDRMPLIDIYGLVHDEAENGRPTPCGVHINPDGDGTLLVVDFDTLTDLEAWRDLFAATAVFRTEVPAVGLTSFAAFNHYGWHGWKVALYAREPLPDDALADRLIAAALSVPVVVVDVTRDGHVKLPLDAYAGHGDDEVTGAPLPQGVEGFAVPAPHSDMCEDGYNDWPHLNPETGICYCACPKCYDEEWRTCICPGCDKANCGRKGSGLPRRVPGAALITIPAPLDVDSLLDEADSIIAGGVA